MLNYYKNMTSLAFGTLMFLGAVAMPVQSQDAGASTERQIDENTQIVYLNFDAGGLPTFPLLSRSGEFVQVPDHIYTPFERDEIQRRIEEDFEGFNVAFTQSQPSSGDFSTIVIGVDDDRNTRDWRGLADAVDFRNLDRNDTALVDTSDITAARYKALNGDKSFSLTSLNFSTGLAGFGNFDEIYSEAIIELAAQVSAHELGHNLGLVHSDALGPIGSGVLPGVDKRFTIASLFSPVYTGPAEATETGNHLIADGSFSLLSERIPNGRVFSERSAIKLSLNDQLELINDEDMSNEFSFLTIPLQKLNVPNTINKGINAGKIFDVDAAVVKSTISGVNDQDVYFFNGEAGDIVTIEVLSSGLQRYSVNEGVITRLQLYRLDENAGAELIAENFQNAKTFDPQILDFELPSDGEFGALVYTSPEAFFASEDSNSPGTVLGSLIDRDRAFLFENGTYEILIYKWGQPQDADSIAD